MTTTKEKLHTTWAYRASLCFLALVATASWAWQSGPEDQPGPLEAQAGRLLGELGSDPDNPNEHGQLLTDAWDLSGLPGALPIGLEAIVPYTLNESVQGEDGLMSVLPAPFDRVTRAGTKRQYNIPGLAALPDHSYSLEDWAEGNEKCPPGTLEPDVDLFGVDLFDLTPARCHTFKTHLGLVNSTHFPPQAQAIYAHYHGLATERATQCRQLADDLSREGALVLDKGSEDGSTEKKRWEMATECEREALSIEAIGQHYLQDSWAIGHMWERWGYGDIRNFLPGIDATDRFVIASAVGAVSGILHGAKAITGQDDDMSSAISPAVKFDQFPDDDLNNATGDIIPGTGDLTYATALTFSNLFPEQKDRLLGCSIKGLRDVYEETAQISGTLEAAPEPDLLDANLTSEQACFAQRATNQAIEAGWAIDYFGNHFTVPELAGAATISLALLPPPVAAVAGALSGNVRDELLAISLEIKSKAAKNPDDTDLATGGGPLENLLGVPRNSLAQPQIPPYIDQPLPWSPSSGRGVATSRLFHRAHVRDFCAERETLPIVLKNRVESPDPETAACQVCMEFSARQIRLNGEASICDDLGLGVSSESLDFSGADDLESAAAEYCGCNNRLRPDPRILIDGVAYEPGVDIEGVFSCQNLGVSVSKTIEVVNVAGGTFNWATRNQTVIGGWTLTGLESTTLIGGESVSGVLTYDCATTDVGGHRWSAVFGDALTNEYDQFVVFTVVMPSDPVILEAISITNEGQLPTRPGRINVCFDAPIIAYYLQFTYDDPQELVADDLSNLLMEIDFESNGCGGGWRGPDPQYYRDFPVTHDLEREEVSVPVAVGLGDTNSDWAKIRVSFCPDSQLECSPISNTIEFDVIRGVNF